MFKIYFTNLGWYGQFTSPGWYGQETFNSIQAAIKCGISKGFSFRVESQDGVDIICAWNSINGTKWYTSEAF